MKKSTHIPDALQNIKNACKKRLDELYPTNIPQDIFSRYEQELSYLEDSNYIEDFELFRLFSKEAVKSSTIIGTRGTLAGSILHYLLSNNSFNPLPAHYYCSKCGYYEVVDSPLFGIDLPKKECPKCGKLLFAKGFNLPIESVWGNDGKKSIAFEYNVATEYLPFAYRILESIYPNNTIVPWGRFLFSPPDPSPHTNAEAIGIDICGYAVLPEGNNAEDYPDYLSHLENGDICMSGSSWELNQHLIKSVRMFQADYINILLYMQRATGIYANEITSANLRDIEWNNLTRINLLTRTEANLFRDFKPKSYREMTCISALTHATLVGQTEIYLSLYDCAQLLSSEAFQKYPCYTGEDVFNILLEFGLERSIAFEISEYIRKGQTSFSKYKEHFDTLPIPEDFKELARRFLYLFPRAHTLEYVLSHAKIAFYASIDSRAFSKAIYKHDR